jgi:hypothetical protein
MLHHPSGDMGYSELILFVLYYFPLMVLSLMSCILALLVFLRSVAVAAVHFCFIFSCCLHCIPASFSSAACRAFLFYFAVAACSAFLFYLLLLPAVHSCFICFCCVQVWHAGQPVPMGLIVPSLLMGSSFGRILGLQF